MPARRNVGAMAKSPPFVDPETRALDTDQLREEAYPLAGLVMLFGGLALVPYLFALLAGGNVALRVLFTVLAQFVLALGAGIVLIYVVARGIQLAEA